MKYVSSVQTSNKEGVKYHVLMKCNLKKDYDIKI